MRNEEKNIVKMLNSIKKQNPHFGEIIVVDEASKDKTKEVVDSYSSRLPIHVLDGGGNPIGFNRNWGGLLAKGDPLFFSEGNCFLKPDLLKKVEALFQDKDLAAWSSCSLPYQSSWYVNLTYQLYDVVRFLLWKLHLGFSISGSVLAIRREIFVKLRGFGFFYNDDGVFGRKIFDFCRRSGYKCVFCIDPHYAVVRSMNRFGGGFCESMNHYIYILTNFLPALQCLLKNKMIIDETKFEQEEHIT